MQFFFLPVMIALASFGAHQERAAIAEGERQAAEAYNLAAGQKAAVAEFHANKGFWPDDNPSAGIANAEDISGRYVKEVRIGVDISGVQQPGIITATLNDSQRVLPPLRGKKLSIVPSYDDGSYAWSCLSDINSSFLPKSCRINQ